MMLLVFAPKEPPPRREEPDELEHGFHWGIVRLILYWIGFLTLLGLIGYGEWWLHK